MTLAVKSVLITDDVDPQCVKILKNVGIEVVHNTTLTKDQLLEEIPKYEGLIVRSATKVTADVIKAGIKLKIIGRAGTGVDNIDVEAATKSGVIVMNTPGGNTISAAEHTCTLIIALSRNLAAASMSMKEGKWDRKKFTGNELFGKTLAIIGLGRIGKEVALRMQSFGMTTIGYDPIISAEESATFNTEWLSLEEIWPLADYITVHTPLIPQTKNLINDAVFAKCRKGIRVVNCARGGIIDEDALLRALESGQCAGAGLDVFLEEPPKDYTLAKHPNVVATPHLGASTVEAQNRVAVEIAEQFVEFAQGTSLIGTINASALTHTLSNEAQPWVQLGKRLGASAAHLTPHISLKHLEVTVCGKYLKDAGSYLAASVLAGYFTVVKVDDHPATVNMVNAPYLAKHSNVIVKTNYIDEYRYGVETVLVALNDGAGHQFELQGTSSGTNSLLVSIQRKEFPYPPYITTNSVVYLARKAIPLEDIIAATAKDGFKVLAVSLSDFTDFGYGVISLEKRNTGKMPNLSALVNEPVYNLSDL